MYYKSPQLMDDLIIGAAVNNRRGAAENQSPTIAAHAAEQMRTRNAVGSAGNALAVGRERLAEQGRQFDQNMDFRQDQVDQYNRNRGTANLLAAGGLGASVLMNSAAQQRHRQQLKAMKKLSEKYRGMGDQDSQFYSLLIDEMMKGVQ